MMEQLATIGLIAGALGGLVHTFPGLTGSVSKKLFSIPLVGAVSVQRLVGAATLAVSIPAVIALI